MFSLIELPYAHDALEPVISARTLEFHHGKHLKAYVDNLNALIAGTPFESMTLEEILLATKPVPELAPKPVPELAPEPVPELVEGPAYKAIFNNAGQILNHNLYFTQFRPAASVGKPVEPPSPHSGLDPESPLIRQIETQWGTLDAFKSAFVQQGATLFGSGWVWLSAAPDGSLVITQEPGASNPICRTVPEPVDGPTGRLRPLLTFDVWEHAYYLDYQNRRAAHLEALWGIVDWGVVEKRYRA